MAVKEIISFDSKLLDTTSVYDSTQAKKQSVINAEVLTALGNKINYADALSLEEIEASTSLTNKVASADAAKSIKESLTYSFPDYTGTKLHTFSTNDRWVAPRDCMLVGYVAYETSQGGYDSAVKVNNVTVATAYNSAGTMYVGVTVPVKSGGIVITATKGDFSHLFAF